MFDLTLKELQEAQRKALDSLIADAGSISHLAKMLNTPYMNVKGWVKRGRISKAGVELVESHMVFREHHNTKTLRPDLQK